MTDNERIAQWLDREAEDVSALRHLTNEQFAHFLLKLATLFRDIDCDRRELEADAPKTRTVDVEVRYMSQAYQARGQ